MMQTYCVQGAVVVVILW